MYCGATHNFIVEKLVKKLSLPLNETPQLWSDTGFGHCIKTQREMSKFWVGEWKVNDSFLHLELEKWM